MATTFGNRIRRLLGRPAAKPAGSKSASAKKPAGAKKSATASEPATKKAKADAAGTPRRVKAGAVGGVATDPNALAPSEKPAPRKAGKAEVGAPAKGAERAPKDRTAKQADRKAAKAGAAADAGEPLGDGQPAAKPRAPGKAKEAGKSKEAGKAGEAGKVRDAGKAKATGETGRVRAARDPEQDKRGEIVFDGGLADFLTLSGEVLAEGRTLLRRDRLHTLWQALLNTRHLNLPVVEIGSFRGGSAKFLAAAMEKLHATPAPFHAIDTFAGHPAEVLDPAIEANHSPGLFGNTSFDEVKAYLAPHKAATVHQGEFSVVAATLPDQQYSFVHIDVDTYLTTKRCLEYFVPRMPFGAVLVLDDFGAPKCPGVAKALHDYLAEHKLGQVWQMRTEQCVLVV